MAESTPGAAGRVVELYTFARSTTDGIGRVWRYAGGDRDVVLAGLVYRAAALTHDAIRRGEQGPKASVQLTVAADLPLVRTLRGADPTEEPPIAPDVPTSVTIVRVDLPDDVRAAVAAAPDGASDATGGSVTASNPRTRFIGQIAACELVDNDAVLTCESLAAALQRDLPRVAFSKQCPWSLYDWRCAVDPTAFAWTGTVTASGETDEGVTRTITMTAGTPPQAGGVDDPTAFDGGLLVVTSGARPARVGIVTATWTTWPTLAVVLLRDDPAVAVGADVTLHFGCQHTVEVCRFRFNNERRFGGFPDLPNRDPIAVGL